MSDLLKQVLTEEAVANCEVPGAVWAQLRQQHATLGIRAGRRRTKGMKHRIRFASAAALVIGAGVLSSGFFSPTMAAVLKSVPVVGALYQFANPVQQNVSTSSTASATDKGITVSIPTAYYDKGQLQFIYTVQVPDGYQASQYSQIAFDASHFTIGGHTVHFGGEQNADKLTSDHRYRGDLELQILSADVPSEGTLVVPVTQVGNVKGNWLLSVPVSSRKVDDGKATYQPMLTKTYDGLSLTVKRIDMGPVNTTVEYQLTQTIDNSGKTKYTLGMPNFSIGMFDSSHKIMWENGSDLPSSIHKEGNQEVWDFAVQYQSPASEKSHTLYVKPSYTDAGAEASRFIAGLNMQIDLK